jgi:hypothetical protein
MYDTERIARIISDIEKYLRDLEELDIKEAKDLADKRNFYAISMVLFSILNRTIDLGEELVMANNLGMPLLIKKFSSYWLKISSLMPILAKDYPIWCFTGIFYPTNTMN